MGLASALSTAEEGRKLGKELDSAKLKRRTKKSNYDTRIHARQQTTDKLRKRTEEDCGSSSASRRKKVRYVENKEEEEAPIKALF